MSSVYRNKKGFVLPVVLMLLAIAMLLGSAAITTTTTEIKIGANYNGHTQAFQIAEAGVEHGRHELNNDDGTNDFETVSRTAGATALLSNGFAGGTYSVSAEPVTGSKPPRVEATAIGCLPAGDPCPSGNAKVIIKGLLERDSLFRYCLFGEDEVKFSGGILGDSFDSNAGSYTPATAGSECNARSNGIVTLTGAGTTLKGDATAAGTVSVSSGAVVTGATTSSADSLVLPPVISPCGGSFSDGTGIAGGDYTPGTGALKGPGGATITLANGTYCFSSISLSGNSALTVNGAVVIYITENSNLSGGTIVNTTGVAANLQIYSSFASSSQGVSVSGGSGTHLAIYAPYCRLSFSGGGDVYGAFVGKVIDNTGGASVHYDEDLGRVTGTVKLVSWKEIF